MLPERCSAPMALEEAVYSPAQPPPLPLGRWFMVHHSPSQQHRDIQLYGSGMNLRLFHGAGFLRRPTKKCKSWQTNGLPQSKQPLRRCLSYLYTNKKHERDSQLRRIEDAIKLAEPEWTATGIIRPLFRRAFASAVAFGPPFKAPQMPVEHAKDEVISNDFADCDDKDLLRKWFDRTSLETLKDAEDEIVEEWLRSPVDPIDESTITSDLLAHTSVAELSDIIIPDSTSEGEDAFPSTFPYTEIPDSQSDNRSLLSTDNSFVMSLDEEDEDYASDPANASDPDYVNESDSNDESDSDDESDSNGEFDSDDDFE
ncbi:hypothetical protein NCS52_00147200 [Fusarium sp. LHS14.1]|nr:hypothetical protein NCS52_00147200 [Fusarium sp. LHS14.1]